MRRRFEFDPETQPMPLPLKPFLVLIILWAILGIFQTAHALERPGFDNMAEWKSAVKKVTEKNDEKTLVEMFAVSKKKLDGYYSTNYTHFLTEVITKRPALFLRVADRYFKHDFKTPLKYVVNEAEGFPKEVRSSLNRVAKQDKEYALAQKFLKLAKQKAAGFGK